MKVDLSVKKKRKNEKEIADGLAMGDQTNSKFGKPTQVAKRR